MMLKRGEVPPEHMANSIYIAWFSKFSGEVVIESADYQLQISESVWRGIREPPLTSRALRAIDFVARAINFVAPRTAFVV